MATTHRIDLTEAPNGKAYFDYRGERLGVSNSPICAAARKLLESGAAFPDERIETYRGSMKCLSARVDAAARLAVDESHGQTRFVTYRPPQEQRQKQPSAYFAVAAE